MAKLNKRALYILSRNRRQVRQFMSPDAVASRSKFLKTCMTVYIWIKCMDGRLNGASLTNMAPGTIQPIRSMGGIVDLGNPLFRALLTAKVKLAEGLGKQVLLFVTYHWSDKFREYGCRAFDDNVDEARTYAMELKRKLEEKFGFGHHIVYPVAVGIETDRDALVIHGEDGSILDMRDHRKKSEEELKQSSKPVLSPIIARMFPDMDSVMADNFVGLLEGNQKHMFSVRRRSIHKDGRHRESVIAVGRGFGWLHEPNLAIIIGPYVNNMEEQIRNAALILQKNLRDDPTMAEKGLVLLISAPYEEPGADKEMAEEEARWLYERAIKVVKDTVGDDKKFMNALSVLPGVVNEATSEFERSKWL